MIAIQPTAIQESAAQQLTECYIDTQRQLNVEPSPTAQVWDETIQSLQRINFRNSEPEEFAKANAYVTLLQQCLVSRARQVPFHGQDDDNS